MIRVLTGDNSFEIDRFVNELEVGFNGQIDKLTSYKLDLNRLLDFIAGVDLFSDNKLVIIRQLSDNKAVWSEYEKWLDKVSDSVDLVLIEPKLDKRTAIYKKLQKLADIVEFNNWSERDFYKAEKWLEKELEKQGVALNKKIVQYLINRVGLDQWQLYNAVLKLALIDDIDEAKIDDIIEPSISDNVFNLIEVVVKGEIKRLKEMLAVFEHTEDVYRLNSLLFSQFCQLVVIKSAGRSDKISKDFKIHPFVIERLSGLAKLLSQAKLVKIINILAEQDKLMKSVQTDPWVIIEDSLAKIIKIIK